MALDIWNEQYKAGNKPSVFSVKKIINDTKPKWCYEVSKCCAESAVIDLGKAFNNFFKNPKHFKHPTFRKRGRKDSFRLDNENSSIDGKRLKIGRMKKPLKLTEELRFEGKIMNCTISKKANKWFASITVDVPKKELTPKNREPRFVGVDLGLKTLAVTSDGVVHDNIKPHRNKLKRLRVLNKSLSRKKLGSNNFKKAVMKLGKLHYRIACVRSDYLHKVTTALVRENDVITIEDLNVSGMVKNRKLSRSISDAGFGMFKVMLAYKCEQNNVVLIKADRFFPSTKTCSKCNSVQEMSLGDRVYSCKQCGLVIDRDLNAAINLNNYGKSYIAAGHAVKVCGLESSVTNKIGKKLSRVKQKLIKKPCVGFVKN